MTLDKKLVRLRKKEGLSQAEVSEKLNVSRQAVSRWESGEARPSTDNLQALCKLYRVPLDYLFNESEDELPDPAPAAPVIESGGQEGQEKRKRRINLLMIGAVVLALLACCLFWYKSSQQKNDMDLHTIQGEDSTLAEEPNFDLNWE